MKALRQLGFLKLSLRPDGTPHEDTRVLALFRNRAELKKAYGGLQDETFRLKDLIKQQEGATQRVQTMLNTLEARLGTAETAYSALVFYQLRRLWQSGRELITAFVADLVRQQEERERRAHLAQHNSRQFGRRQTAESNLSAAQLLHREASAALAALSGQRPSLGRFWHYFQRRSLEQRITAADSAVTSANATLAEAQLAVDDVAREPAPEFPGLSLATRRAINLAAIAYAEILCSRLAELKTPLVKLACQATAQREAGDDYGSPRECVLLMGQIARAQRLIADRAGISEQLKVRVDSLQHGVRYRGPADSTPLNESIALSERDAIANASFGPAARLLPNVLAEDTWDLFRILLR